MARGISCTAVYFRTILTTKGTTTVGTAATIGIYNNFTSGKAGIAVGATNYKFTGWVNMVNGILIKHFGRNYLLYCVLNYITLNFIEHLAVGFFLA